MLAGTAAPVWAEPIPAPVWAEPIPAPVWAEPIDVPARAEPIGAPIAPAAETKEPSRDDVIVNGQRQRRTGESGSKTDTPLIELPQTVTVIDQEELVRRNALSINQALGYVAGVSPNQRGNVATRYDQLFIRGFQPAVFMDGLRLLGGVYSSPQVDFHLVERVDVIKGPASVLYGNATPGGVVNLQSKLPHAESGGLIELAAGNYDLLRSAIDVNRPLDAQGKWLFRVIAGAERSDGFVALTENRRHYVRPMLTFAPDGVTSVTLILNYQRDPESASYSGVPVYGSALPNPFGRFPVDLNVSEPAYEEFDREQRSATLLFHRRLSDALTWTTNARYYDVGLNYRQIYLAFSANTNLDAAGNTDQSRILRGGGGADEEFRTITIDNRLTATFDTGPVGHTLLAGVDWQNNRGNNVQAFATGPNANPAINIPNLDLFDPHYAGRPGGGVLPSRDLGLFPGVVRNFRKIDQVGVYLQDQLAIGGLRLIASGRWDWYDQLTRNRNLALGDPRAITRLSQNAFTTRLGALYETKVGLAPFASYSESFEPQAGAAFDGTPFVPVTGRQYEAGLKYQPPGRDALFTFSAFDLRRRNVPAPDPANTGFSVQIGEVRVRGLELDGRGEIAPGLNLVLAGGYTDARVTQGSPPVGTGDQLAGVTGTRPLGVPKWSASGFVSYDLKNVVSGPLGGVELGGGVRYVGASDGTAQSVQARRLVIQRFRSPDFLLVDAVLSYDFGAFGDRFDGLSLSLNAANLLDKRHVASCFFNNSCYFGASRTVVATLRQRW